MAVSGRFPLLLLLGIVAVVKGDTKLGGWSIGACIVGAIAGMAIAAALLDSTDDAGAILALIS